MKVQVKIYKKNKLIKRMIGDRSKWRKLHAKLASAGADKWFIRVEYGIQKDHRGKDIMFFNEYKGINLAEAKQALSAFIEE